MLEILKGAGVFVYPLMLCSLAGGFIIFERLFALRRAAIIPAHLVEGIVEGSPSDGGGRSALGRIIAYGSAMSRTKEPCGPTLDSKSIGWSADLFF
jgi:biopolymer transport protein ExbB